MGSHSPYSVFPHFREGREERPLSLSLSLPPSLSPCGRVRIVLKLDSHGMEFVESLPSGR